MLAGGDQRRSRSHVPDLLGSRGPSELAELAILLDGDHRQLGLHDNGTWQDADDGGAALRRVRFFGCFGAGP